MNDQNYFLFDTPCKEIIPEEFICQETNPIKTTEDSPCEIQLLKFANNLSNCRVVSVKIDKVKIQNLELNKWIVLIPKLTVAMQKCGKNRENIPLIGTYILELNPICEIKIKNNIVEFAFRITNNFHRDQYKLVNHAVFGNCMEAVEKRKSVKLVKQWENTHQKKGAHTYISQSKIESVKLFNENFVGIQLKQVVHHLG